MARTRTHGEAAPNEVVQQAGAVDRIRLLVGLVATGTLILFLAQNWQHAEIHFLWFDWSTRMIWALLASSVAGALAMVLFATLRRGGRAER